MHRMGTRVSFFSGCGYSSVTITFPACCFPLFSSRSIFRRIFSILSFISLNCPAFAIHPVFVSQPRKVQASHISHQVSQVARPLRVPAWTKVGVSTFLLQLLHSASRPRHTNTSITYVAPVPTFVPSLLPTSPPRVGRPSNLCTTVRLGPRSTLRPRPSTPPSRRIPPSRSLRRGRCVVKAATKRRNAHATKPVEPRGENILYEVDGTGGLPGTCIGGRGKWELAGEPKHMAVRRGGRQIEGGLEQASGWMLHCIATPRRSLQTKPPI